MKWSRLSGMGRLEKLVLGMDDNVSCDALVCMGCRLCHISARHVIVTCGPKCHLVFVCVCVSNWRS